MTPRLKVLMDKAKKERDALWLAHLDAMSKQQFTKARKLEVELGLRKVGPAMPDEIKRLLRERGKAKRDRVKALKGKV